MSRSVEQLHRDAIGGERSLAASLFRGFAAALAPGYAAAVAGRNALLDRKLIAVARADRPVISVGNLTAGGTGKTPVVEWLARQLRLRNFNPAILMRGHKSQPGQSSDEQKLLVDLLGNETIVHANPDRVEGARQVIAHDPDVDVFVLDDGFQHRKLHRDFDLVLIDASSPFGGGHLLPRGYLREPVSALRRASAILLTHVEAAKDLGAIVGKIREHSNAKIFHSRHVWQNAEMIRDRRIFAVSGIGNPAAFERQIESSGGTVCGSIRFGDHHHYSNNDVAEFSECAAAANAEAILTTQKDWVKLASVSPNSRHPPIWVAKLSIQFEEDDERELLSQIIDVIQAARSTSDSTGRTPG